MNLDELRPLVADGESERLELKRSTAELERGLRTVCGMLNNVVAGHVVFGVNDRGEIVGQAIGDNTIEQIAQRLQTQFEPVPPVGIEQIPVEGGRDAIVLRVGIGGDLFAYEGQTYERVGRTTRRMPQATFQRRILERAHANNRWEMQRADGFMLKDLDTSEIVRTVEEAIRRQRLEDPGTRSSRELLLGLGLIEDRSILNAAVVLFGKPERLRVRFPQCVLRMARFRGVTTAEFIDNRQEIGNAFDLFLRGQRFFRDYLPVAGQIVPDRFERVDRPLYPPEALREALANAICHRDYRDGGGSVSIAIFDDRLEITSTGPLPFDQSVEELTRPHPSRPWNPLIARAFYLRGIIETWGRGTLRIIELAQRAGLPTPEFEATRHSVTVRFRPSDVTAFPADQQLPVVQRRILTALVELGPSSLSRIQSKIGQDVPSRTIQNNLRALREQGLVHLSGSRRDARWSLAPGGNPDEV